MRYHRGFKIKAVTLDLWETLLLGWNGVNDQRIVIRCRKLVEVLREFGIEVSVDRVISAVKAMNSWLLRIWNKNLEVSNLDQIHFIITHSLKKSISLEGKLLNKLSSAYTSAIFELPPYVNPDAPILLQWLKNHHKKIGLISNVGMTPGFALRRFLLNVDLGEFFDVMIFSDEVGIRKPHPRIFHLAAEKLGVRPCEVVHIGDNMRSDVLGAKNAGFKAFFFSALEGRDRRAESDPNSLVFISRRLGEIKDENIIPDKVVTSLRTAIKAIKELENI